MRLIKLLFLSTLCLGTPAVADDIRPVDQPRLEAFDAHFGAAVYQALTEGSPSDQAVMLEALSGAAGTLDPVGEWNCRTIKMGGGLLPLVSYRNFRCRITDGPGPLYTLVKLTGSQRVKGKIWPGGLFLGVGHVGEAPATDYAGLPPDDQTPVEPNQTTADVGRFEQMSPNRARLMLPAPLLESRFDILYLTR